MTARRATAAVAALAVLLAARTASGGPLGDLPELPPSDHMRLTSGEGLLKLGGREIVIPMGSHILTPPAWDKLDVEMRRLQELEVRLVAENDFMKHKVSGWQPGWRLLSVTLLVGVVAGGYVGYKLF